MQPGEINMINLADDGRSWISGEGTYELANPLPLFFCLLDIPYHEIGIIIQKTGEISGIIDAVSAGYNG
jgi:hypothetical protein